MGRRRAFCGFGLVCALVGGAFAGCGGDPNGTGIGGRAGAGGSGPLSGGGVGGGGPPGRACDGLFDGTLRTFSIEISPTEWQSLVDEFNNVAALQTGQDFAVYHPVVFRLGDERVEAAVKLRGQSSWLLAVTLDGARAKMQLNVSFNEVNPDAKFHGHGKLKLDMPRSDWTFLHDRLAHTWLRQVGILAPCSTNARLEINGSYYGLYTMSENVGGRLVEEFFPDNPDGDLWKGGTEPETNQMSPSWGRAQMFRAATDLPSMAAIVDIEGSLRSWAAEALLNNGDGYYGGFHNFYAYDQGAKGLVYIPQDTDSTFEWLDLFDLVGHEGHPIFWWEGRGEPRPPPGPHWGPVMRDPSWRQRYAAAIDDLLRKWDVPQLQSFIDGWSADIADDVAADPHTWTDVRGFETATALARDIVANRPVYLRSFVQCMQGSGADRDGDGYRWCEDCRDDDASISLSATEVCGNGLDDNCNGLRDEGC